MKADGSLRFEELTRIKWLFGNEGAGPSSSQFVLGESFEIEGYEHYNEHSWLLDDGEIKIFNADGGLTWRFQRDPDVSEITYRSTYQPEPHLGLRQVLIAAAYRFPALQIANMSHVRAALGDRVSLMHCEPPCSYQPARCKGDDLIELSADMAADQLNIHQKLTIHGPELWLFKQAIMVTRHGIVVIGSYVINESLLFFPYHLYPEIIRQDDILLLPEIDLLGMRECAYHGCSGNLENYFHFFCELVAKLAPIYVQNLQAFSQLDLVTPALKKSYQIEMMQYAETWATGGSPATLNDWDALFCDALVYPRQSPASSLYPHISLRPFVAGFIRTLVPGLVATAPPPARKLYISRRDSSNRVLENEAEIENVLSAIGFEVVVLSGMSVAEQIELFYSAQCVITPHGAGLTNIVFCRPGATIIELHMNGNFNWVYRRIAHVFELNYDFVAGSVNARQTNLPVHGRDYSISVPDLISAIVAAKLEV
jgi:hypothetical protein